MKKKGRPRIAKELRRSVRIPVRIRASEDAALKGEAEAKGMKYTDYLRSKILA